jgi:hypothetical protein
VATDKAREILRVLVGPIVPADENERTEIQNIIQHLLDSLPAAAYRCERLELTLDTDDVDALKCPNDVKPHVKLLRAT